MRDDKESTENNSINDPLARIVKGTGLVIVASLLVYLFALIVGVLIARTWTAAEVGLLTLAATVFHICSIIGTLGIGQGIVRSIAHAKGKEEDKKIPDFIVATFFYCGLLSIILFLILFLLLEKFRLCLLHLLLFQLQQSL